MEARQREYRYYQTVRGRIVFSEWLHALRDRKVRACIRIRLDRLEGGNIGDHRSVGEGVTELRLEIGPGYRVYVAEDVPVPVIVVPLCSGDKGSQERNIRSAKAYRRGYRERGEIR